MRKWLIMFVLCSSFLFCSSTASAAEESMEKSEQIIFYEKDYLENAEFEIAEFSILCYTPMDFYGMTLRLYFQNIDTGKVFCIESESSEYKESAFQAELPIGTYKLYNTTLNDNTYFNYQYSINPEEFSLSSSGIEENSDNTLIFLAKEHTTVAMNKMVGIRIEATCPSAEVQIGFSGISNAFYSDGRIYQRNIYLADIKEKWDSFYMAEGIYEVQKINAYDADKNSLNILYKPEIQIKSHSEESPFYTVYVFSEEYPIKEEKKAQLKEEGYMEKMFSDMDDYAYSYNKHIAVAEEYLDKLDNTTYVNIESMLSKINTSFKENVSNSAKNINESELEEMKHGDPGMDDDSDMDLKEKIVGNHSNSTKKMGVIIIVSLGAAILYLRHYKKRD